MKLILACCNIKNIVIFKTYTEIKIPLIYDFIRFEIHLPAVVAVDGVPVFNVVVTIVLVVGVIPVIAVIKVHIELNYYLRNKLIYMSVNMSCYYLYRRFAPRLAS